MVDKLVPEAEQWVGKEMRVHGWVEAGTIKEEIDGQVTKRSFVVTREGKRLTVRHEGPKPDTFRDGSEVVASGVLRKEGSEHVFVAREIMAKCPSKYEGAASNKQVGAGRPVFTQ